MLEQGAHRSFNLLSQPGSTWIPSFLVSCKLVFLSRLLPHSFLITCSSESAPLGPGSQGHCGMMSLLRAPGRGLWRGHAEWGWIFVKEPMHWASSQRPQREQMASLTPDATQENNFVYSIKTTSVLLPWYLLYINMFINGIHLLSESKCIYWLSSWTKIWLNFEVNNFSFLFHDWLHFFCP